MSSKASKASTSSSGRSRRQTGIPLINMSRSKMKQKKPRSQWVVYLAKFISHRYTMLGVWNTYQKPSPIELATMFKPESLPDMTAGSSYSSSGSGGDGGGGATGVEGNDRRQRNSLNEPVKTIAELYACASEVKGQCDQIMTYLALKTKFKLSNDLPDAYVQPNSFYVPPLKDKVHAHNKAKEKYSYLTSPAIAWVRDIVRYSFSCASFADMESMFDAICNCKDLVVVGTKNRFVNQTFGNYRDLLLYIRLAAADAPKLVCEIQFHLNEFQRYCLSNGGYDFYIYFRYFFLGCVDNPKRLNARLKCIKKMDQLGENYDELERFVDDFLTMGGRVSRDLERLEAFNDLFLLTAEFDLMEKIQKFHIAQLRSHGAPKEGELSLAMAKMVNIFVFRREYAKALPVAEEALALCIKFHGESSLQTAAQLYNMAGLFHCQYMLHDSLPLYEQALSIKRIHLPYEHEECLGIVRKIAETFECLKEISRAEEVFIELLELQKRTFGDSPEVCSTMESLAFIAFSASGIDRIDEADRRYGELLALQKSVFGERHVCVGDTIQDIGHVKDRQGRFQDAFSYYREALSIYVEAMVPNKVSGFRRSRGGTKTVAASTPVESMTYIDVLGIQVPEFSAAQDSLRLASVLISIANVMAEIDTRSGGPQCPLTSEFSPPPSSPEPISADQKVYLTSGVGRRQARILVDRALRAYVAQLGENDLLTATAMNAMGELLVYDGEIALSRQILDCAQSIRHSILGGHNAMTKQTHSNLDAMYELAEIEANRKKKLDGGDGMMDDNQSMQGSDVGASEGTLETEIAEVVQQSIEIISQYQQDQIAVDIDELTDEGHALRDEGGLVAAEERYREALTLAGSRFGTHHPCYAIQLCNLAGVYEDGGKYCRAIELLGQAEVVLRKAYADVATDKGSSVSLLESNEYLATVLLNTGICHMSAGNFDDAIANFDEAEEIYKKISLLYSAMVLPQRKPDVIPTHIEQPTEGKDGENNDYDQEEDGNGDTCGEDEEKDRELPPPLENTPSIDRNLHFLQHYPGFIISLKSRGQCLEFKGLFSSAEALYLRVLHLSEFVRGKHHPDYASMLNSMGLLKLQTGQLDEAAAIFQSVMKLRESSLGKQHPSYGYAQHNLALVFAARRNYAWAGKTTEEAMEISRRNYGKKSHEVSRSLMNLERLLVSQGNSSLGDEIKSYLLEYGHQNQ